MTHQIRSALVVTEDINIAQGLIQTEFIVTYMALLGLGTCGSAYTQQCLITSYLLLNKDRDQLFRATVYYLVQLRLDPR